MGEPPRLVPGMSAYACWKYLTAVILASSAFVGCIAIPAFALHVGAPWREPLILLFAGLAIATALSGVPVFVLLTAANKREHAAGYTTTFGERPDLWQLHPRTGEVIRSPAQGIR